MRPAKCIIFCATQRTGSTVVFDDLRNVLGYGPTYSEILYDRIILNKSKVTWSELWVEVAKVNTVQGYFVDKVMFHYTPQISSFIDGKSITNAERCLKFAPQLFDSFYDFFADAIWVCIYRRDVFAQAVSMYLAEATEIWERRVGEPWTDGPRTPEIAYDSEKLKNYLNGFLAEREQWQCFFQHYNITPIRISYEEVAAGYPHYLREVLDRAGLHMVDTPWQRRLLKLGDQVNEQWAEFLRNEVILELYSRSRAGA
jgi:LPS sulfotransferase NodH